MNILDKNQTVQPPDGYDLCTVRAEGSYLRLEYRRLTSSPTNYSVVVIYLTDMGREIARTIEDYQEPVIEQAVEDYVPRRFKLWNGFLIILEGIRGMFQ